MYNFYYNRQTRSSKYIPKRNMIIDVILPRLFVFLFRRAIIDSWKLKEIMGRHSCRMEYMFWNFGSAGCQVIFWFLFRGDFDLFFWLKYFALFRGFNWIWWSRTECDWKFVEKFTWEKQFSGENLICCYGLDFLDQKITF